jgi:hypothetical protein
MYSSNSYIEYKKGTSKVNVAYAFKEVVSRFLAQGKQTVMCPI